MTDYEVIETLWYSTRENGEPNAQLVDYITEPSNSDAYNNVRSLYTSPAAGFEPKGNKYTISYEGVRTPKDNLNSDVTDATYKESFVINEPLGTVTGISVYPDSGTGNETTINNALFNCTSGTGKFEGAYYARITYDNKGDILGPKFSRKITIYKRVI